MHVQLNIGHLGASGRVIPLKGYVFNTTFRFRMKWKGVYRQRVLVCCAVSVCCVLCGAFTVIRTCIYSAPFMRPTMAHIGRDTGAKINAWKRRFAPDWAPKLKPFNLQTMARKWTNRPTKSTQKTDLYTLLQFGFYVSFGAVLSSVIGLISA